MTKYTLREWFRYHFENKLSSGPMAVIRWLGIASIVSVALLGLVIWIMEISNLGFVEGTWQSLLATLDPGTMGNDKEWEFRIVRFIATLIGIFIISILIGSITSGINQKIEQLKRGHSRVLDSDHTLILGWSGMVFTILSEIIEANSNKKNQCIVILS